MHVVKDHRGSAVSGATSAALEHFEAALADFQAWCGDPQAHLALALDSAPEFVMAHVLDAYVLICSRDPEAFRAAHEIYKRASRLPMNARESLHVQAIAAVVCDEIEAAKTIFDGLLTEYPRDVLALQAVHAFDYLTGERERMAERTCRVMRAWSPQLPGYHAVLSMHAFAQIECGEYLHAEDLALRALHLNPCNARAHHAMAHVYEMSGRVDQGIQWLRTNEMSWAVNTNVATHCWWHLALFHLQHDGAASAIALYDRRVRRQRSTAISDLIDASSLLWRVLLHDEDCGERWKELAACWAPHIDDAFCTFNDVHAMLAFMGAREWDLAQALLDVLSKEQFAGTRHGKLSRLAGIPACRALLAFAHEDYTTAAGLLGALPAVTHRLGGSHAQREVLHLTLIEAAQRSRQRCRSFRVAA